MIGPVSRWASKPTGSPDLPRASVEDLLGHVLRDGAKVTIQQQANGAVFAARYTGDGHDFESAQGWTAADALRGLP